MYNISQKQDIYLYDISRGVCVRHFKDLDEVIEFLARFKAGRLFWWDRSFKENISYLNEINLNGNDIWGFCEFIGNRRVWCYFIRPWMFVDDTGRIIDMRIYSKEIDKRVETFFKKKKEVKDKDFERGDMLVTWKGQPFRYRIDPVPGVKKYSSYRCCRHPKTTQERHNNISDSYKDYTRGKRRNLPTSYDDIFRTNASSKSWKNQGKHRHQWQKNLK